MRQLSEKPLTTASGLDLKSKAVPLKLSVPLAELPAGQYTCQITILDPNWPEGRLLASARQDRSLASSYRQFAGPSCEGWISAVNQVRGPAV